MKTLKTLLFMAALTVCNGVFAAKNVSVSSPNGLLTINIQVADGISYSVVSGNDVVLKNCQIGLTLSGERLGEKPQVKSIKRLTYDENIQREIPIKNAIVKNHANEVRLTMKGGYRVDFRAYDNGVAYRFVTEKKGQVTVDDEMLEFDLDSESQLTMSQCGTFRQNYEERYVHLAAREYTKESPMNYLPLYVQTPKGYQVLFSESAVEDYPHMFLKSNGKGGMKAVFPKFALEVEQQWDRFLIPTKEAEYIAETDGTRPFPWRFFVISKDARDIVANEMEYVLATPNVIGDTSWIRPGQVAWDWWNCRQAWGVDFKAGCNEETYKYFIDFAAKYGVKYIILDEGWAVSTADPFHTNKDINMPRLIQYGKEKGVDLILWLTWLEVERNFNLFEEYEKWGIAGVKIDFMDRSDQWMVNYYERVCKEAAKHHLLVDFHGSFKPAGLERKYPNLISYEAVLGLEQGGRCKPENTNWLPFVRNAVGPMDFTPGGMLNVQPENNQTTNEVGMASGTRAYQMALYVLFTTGIQMLADTPSRYYQNPDCTEFITSVPVLWDETRVLLAEPGKYCVMARRSGSRWFIGGINDNDPRDVEIDLSFLDSNAQQLTLFTDGENSDRKAIDYRMYKGSSVSANSPITIHMARNGGFAGVITPRN
ncbi:MAG: glycoside hydrolase family 97 protein [Prevotella sp.]|nr:glycoside hydrolase family 97 protein [Prevotella sp.]